MAKKSSGGGFGKIHDADVVVLAQADPDRAGPGEGAERAQVGVVAVEHHPAVARDDAREMPEGTLDVGAFFPLPIAQGEVGDFAPLSLYSVVRELG